MGFDNRYPYTDFHEINLDWLLEKVKGIDDRFVALEDAVAALREDLDIQTGRIDAALDAITFIENHYPAMIASQYDESRQYDPGEIAIYDNELYIALPGETPGPWNGNYWNKTSLGDELGTIIIKVNDIILPDLTNINNVLAEYGTLFDDIVETYDPNFTYFKNNFVKYEDHIYMVIVESTINPPTDTADWDPVTFANVFSYYINNLNVFVPEFQDNITYHQYDYVRYNNFVYYCKETTFRGAWDPSKWENCVLSMDLAFRMRAFYEMFGELFGWFASYDDANTYNKGNVINYNGTLYECLYDGVTGAWDASKWQTQKVTDAMTDVNTYYKNFPVKTLNGNPVKISDAIKAPAESAVVSFNPVQEGTGTPSPGNPRPIAGKNSLILTVSEDLFYNFVQGGINDTTGLDVSISTRIRSGYVKCPKSSFTLTLSNPQNNNERIRSIYFYTEDNTFINSELIESINATITAPSNAAYIRVVLKFVYDPTITPQNETVVVNQLSSNTAEFPNIVYGGSYDFVSGNGQSEWGYIASYNGETITEPWLSSIDEYIPNTSPSTGAEVVYHLSAPVPFTLPGKNIMTLSGNNTIWSDGDNVEISYHYADKSVDYTPDGRDVVIGTYSGKRVIQRNTFLQNIALDATQHTYNDVFPAGKLVLNAWLVAKGNDDSSSGINLPGVINDDGSVEFALYSWGNNTAADVWLYIQYVE